MRRAGAHDFSIVLAAAVCCFIGQLTLGIHIKECDEALGMESGAIPDSAITASSSYNVPNVGPSNGRMYKILKVKESKKSVDMFTPEYLRSNDDINKFKYEINGNISKNSTGFNTK
ncbi:Galactose-binding domain-like, partial [Cinara cedri]